MIDDSALFHGAYDPVKAREYYLRTRKLKGRQPGAAKPASGHNGAGRKGGAGGKANRANTKSRRAELLAQKVALEKRLDHLREVLAQKVKEAKATSHKNAPKPKKKAGKEAPAAPETKADVADRNSDEKSKKLTPTQKTAKAKQAKEAYEKEHPNSLSTQVDVLQLQVQDIRAKIQKAISDAHPQKHQAGKQTTKVRSKVKPNDGPRGR